MARARRHDVAAALRGQDDAAVERVEQHLLAVHARARDEVAGQPDTHHLESEPPSHLDEDERQRDGNAEPPIEDVVEIAIARIGVVLRVAGEPLFLEEAFAQPVELSERIADCA